MDDGIVLIATPPAIPNPGFAEHDSATRTSHPYMAFVKFPYTTSNQTPLAKHEISEAITDPRWRFDGCKQWVDDCGCELADICGGPGSGLSVGESPSSTHDVTTLWL